MREPRAGALRRPRGPPHGRLMSHIVNRVMGGGLANPCPLTDDAPYSPFASTLLAGRRINFAAGLDWSHDGRKAIAVARWTFDFGPNIRLFGFSLRNHFIEITART